MLEIRNLHAGIEGKEILKGVNLTVNAGEVHAIMGPNGSGKSTLAQVLAGRDTFDVTAGEILINGENIAELEPEERAAKGMFLAFQYPVEIPGVRNNYFLRTALNSVRKARGEQDLDAMEFLKLIKEKAKLLKIDESFMSRSVNEGFSGGEKKRNEILQMAILDPKLCVMDETDSGLDIDALKVVARGVQEVRTDRSELGVLLITHYQRILEYLRPDKVHVLIDGRIVDSGGPELAERLEQEGYEAWR